MRGEVLTGPERRRRWSASEKLAVVRASLDTSKNRLPVGFEGMLMGYGWRYCRIRSALDAVLA